MNPTLSQKVVDRALERDPMSAASEYLALFRSDVETFISLAAVEACVIEGRQELPPGGLAYRAFCDPSGGSHDSMTLAIAQSEDKQVVVDLVREVKPPFSPEDVVKDFSGILKRYNVSTVVGDKYGGLWPRERFAEHGISYKTASKTKSEYYCELLPLLNAKKVELPDNQRLINQLVGLERKTGRSGRDSIDHAPRAFDDLINACAGAVVEAQRTGGAPGKAQMIIPSEEEKRRFFEEAEARWEREAGYDVVEPALNEMGDPL